MSRKPAIYLSDIASFKANDNHATRIEPMQIPKNKRGRIRRALLYIALAGAGYYGLSVAVPRVADHFLDRLEAEREYSENYNCAYYGAAMNRFYGRDVCEDESVHRELLKTSNR